ncbi:MAG: TolC family protein [Polyangiales bacterium]
MPTRKLRPPVPTKMFALLVCVGALAGLSATRAHAQPLTVSEALALAVTSNPTVRAASAQIESAEAGVASAEGARVPTLTLDASGRHSESINVAANGVASSSQDQVSTGAAATFQTGIGTSVTVGSDTAVRWVSTNLDPSRTDLFRIGPIYSAGLSLGVRQPLMRGAGRGATTAPRREAEARQRAAERSRDATISQLALDVIVAHWELWYSQEALAIADAALTLAIRADEEARIRHEELQTLAANERLRYAAELARARRTHANAAAELENRAVALGQLIGVQGARTAQLRAAAEPIDYRAPSTLEALLDAARANSSQLLALEADIEAADARVTSAANSNRARVDLTGSLEAAVVFTEETISPLQLPGNRPALSGSVGLEVELPLGRSQQSAEHQRARAERDLAVARYDEAVRALDAEVASLRTTLTTSEARLVLSADAADTASRLADSERERLGLGTGTVVGVLDAQQDAREAALELRRAQADYAETLASLQHTVGALVERDTAELSTGDEH